MTLFNETAKSVLKKFTLAFCLCSSLTGAMAVNIEPAQANSNAFFNAGFNYCDAKLIASYWGMGIGQAKASAGQKILAGNTGNVKAVMQASRNQGNRCGFEDTGLTYDDAATLAAFWGWNDVGQMKSKIASYYTDGQDGVITNALRQARQQRQSWQQPAPQRPVQQTGGATGIGNAYAVQAVQYTCMGEGVTLFVNLISEGNSKYIQASYDNANSGNLRKVSNTRYSNGKVTLSFKNGGRKVNMNWDGFTNRCSLDN